MSNKPAKIRFEFYREGDKIWGAFGVGPISQACLVVTPNFTAEDAEALAKKLAAIAKEVRALKRKRKP